MLKFLIDECLSPSLAQLARDRGYHESFHVSWLGKAGWKDWELKDLILSGDWTFVTRNSIDFRGAAERPGSKGQYADVPIHAGLVCINGPAEWPHGLKLSFLPPSSMRSNRSRNW